MSPHIIPAHVPNDRPARESRQDIADCPSCRRYTVKTILSRQGVCVPCRELGRVLTKRMERPGKAKKMAPLCANCHKWTVRPGWPMCSTCNTRVGGKAAETTVSLENARQLAKNKGMTSALLQTMTGCGEFFADKTMAEFDGTLDRIRACKTRKGMEQFSRGQVDAANVLLFGEPAISSGIWAARLALYYRLNGRNRV